MDIECHTCRIFEGISNSQEVEAIAPAIFSASEGLAEKISKLSLSKFIRMVKPVLVIFDTLATYSRYSNHVYSVDF